MMSGNLLFSALHFFVVFFVLTVGAFFLVLPYADQFRTLLIDALFTHLSYFQLFGGLLVGIGSLFLFGLYMMHRHRFFQIQMQASKIEVDEKVIRKIVEDYWKSYFPNHAYLTDVTLKGKQELEIFTTLPEEKEEDFFEAVQNELGGLLARQLGYQKPFTLTLVEIFQ